MQNGTDNDWEQPEAANIVWLDEALGRMKEELDCIERHWEDAKGEFFDDHNDEYNQSMYDIAKHCENLVRGSGLLLREFVERYCRPQIVVQLAADKMQEQLGKPVTVVGGALSEDGMFGGFLLQVEDVHAPDDASEIEEEP